MKNMQQAKELGYSVEMYYVGVANAQTAIERVANRVKNGGHGIPDETIEKRYSQSMENLAKAIPLCDRVKIYDNTEQFLRFASYEQGKMVSLDENLTPQWFKQNFLQGLDIMHEQSYAEIPDGKLPVLQDKEKRILEKETTPLKATSLSDRIAQKKA